MLFRSLEGRGVHQDVHVAVMHGQDQVLQGVVLLHGTHREPDRLTFFQMDVALVGPVAGIVGQFADHGPGPAPRIRGMPSHAVPAPGVGDRILARIKAETDGTFTARPLRLLESGPGEVLGVFELAGGEGRIIPANKKERSEFRVRGSDTGGAKPGEVVLADVVGRAGGMGMLRAKVKERVGDIADPRTLSLIAIHQHGIPTRFSPEALQEADEAVVPELGRRTDFRQTPLITIDPVDARDFDDAVFAEPVAASDLLSSYGAFLVHCGATAMGNPGPEGRHPLHGELPQAPFQTARLLAGADGEEIGRAHV